MKSEPVSMRGYTEHQRVYFLTGQTSDMFAGFITQSSAFGSDCVNALSTIYGFVKAVL